MSDIPFTPVPTASTRHDGWTPARQRRFIDHLAQWGGVVAAARAVGMTKQSAYRLRDRPGAESFAEAWGLALDMGRDRAREVAIDRGLNGYSVAVTYAGKVVGQRLRVDNRLLYAACYGERPPPLDPTKLR